MWKLLVSKQSADVRMGRSVGDKACLIRVYSLPMHVFKRNAGALAKISTSALIRAGWSSRICKDVGSCPVLVEVLLTLSSKMVEEL